MEKLQNFEFQYSFFMKTLLANQINGFFAKDDPIDLKRIEVCPYFIHFSQHNTLKKVILNL